MSLPLEGTAVVLIGTTEPGQGQATTTSLAPGAVGSVSNIQDLRNRLDVPMLVDEILFNVVGNSLSDPGVQFGGDIRLGLRLGSDGIVKTYTPLWLLGGGKNFSVASSATGPTLLASQLNSSIFGMRLASELILYPGEYLNPTFYNAAQLASGSVAIRMIVRGRAMKADAQRQSLPWISYFVGAVQTPGSDYTEETVEGDLHNPFNVPLALDRMVGGIANDDTGAYAQGFYGDPACMDAGLNYATLRMVDGNGQPIIRDFTPVGHLFQLQDFSWRLKGSMPAGSFWKAYISEAYSNISVIAATTPNLQLMMSLIGHRPISGKATGP
ncbi:MAG: hypothetical protein ACYC6M_03145 [Terriglobales bacterium]